MKPKSTRSVRWATQRKKLLAIRDQLLGQRAGLRRDAVEPMDQTTRDFADEASDVLNHELAARVFDAEGDILNEVEDALKRIDGGAYGICEATGQKIPRARLIAIPWTRYTAEAESALEKDGIAPGLIPVPRNGRPLLAETAQAPERPRKPRATRGNSSRSGKRGIDRA